jgi:hypothetical protein
MESPNIGARPSVCRRDASTKLFLRALHHHGYGACALLQRVRRLDGQAASAWRSRRISLDLAWA